MENEIFRAGNYTAKVVRCNTAIVGSGAAGFNAADRLWQLGQRDIVLVTENRVGGTSRNTGSDKQTYYKLTLSGATPTACARWPTHCLRAAAWMVILPCARPRSRPSAS
ncbi:MAG: hypothetical protein ACLRYE_02890 [Gemmiger formicilis]|uniref:hypothetical protein n=1 Tax=Gemmiger formicilis TaxID=745368 RepID=UPI00399FCE58